MADKQSGARAEASSRGLILRVLSPEEPLCLLFLFPFSPHSHRGLSPRTTEFNPSSQISLYKPLPQAQNHTTHILGFVRRLAAAPSAEG